MAKAIMIQGTMSNVGKSLICAALCRIFRQDGYRAAPFKSQNMALNSCITRDGLEMGRAQYMQAEAAGIEPSVLMNPILLKPTANSVSQVIVNGRPIGNMSAREYFKHRKNLAEVIKKSYDELLKQTDIIVIEGAGSPAELNLKKDDIVNMGMAEIADAPVILAGDIDRGGIFAQLIGTVSLLEEHERQRVKGLIVNKFRGDISLFDDGVKILEEKIGKPVLGVIPYIDCDVDDEDSLCDSLSGNSVGAVDIAVIRLPKISNFTDFNVFRQYEKASVRYVSKYVELGDPDMIIIPGSKNTISDMKWLRESFLESAVIKKAKSGTPVFGICGGYQMLGKTISDPEKIENGGKINGMGLLDMHTVLHSDKIQRRSTGTVIAENSVFSRIYGADAEGYEIHQGETTGSEKPFILFPDGRTDGAYNGNVFGTYLHGIFDNTDISYSIMKELFRRHSMTCNIPVSCRDYKEKQYDILAENVRNSIDLNRIYEFIFKA